MTTCVLEVNKNDEVSQIAYAAASYMRLLEGNFIQVNFDSAGLTLKLDETSATDLNEVLKSLLTIRNDDDLSKFLSASKPEYWSTKKGDELMNEVLNHLSSNSFVENTQSATLSDIICSIKLRNDIAKLIELKNSNSSQTKKIWNSRVDLVRWFDHIQRLDGIEKAFQDLNLIIDNINDSPFYKQTEATQPVGSQASSKLPASAERPLDDIDRLEIRVGKVIKAWPHPDADELYCEEVDIGENLKIRQIASGLRKYVPHDKLEGSLVCVLCNMKAKNLRGFPSHGMLMCAASEDHTTVELMVPPSGSKLGERVMFGDEQQESPDEVLSSKANKNPLEVIFPELRTNEECEGIFRGRKMKTGSGIVKCTSIKLGFVR